MSFPVPDTPISKLVKILLSLTGNVLSCTDHVFEKGICSRLFVIFFQSLVLRCLVLGYYKVRFTFVDRFLVNTSYIICLFVEQCEGSTLICYMDTGLTSLLDFED